MDTKDVILDLRTRHGLSQDELAEKVFVTRQAVSRWENGETVPNTDTLKLLSKLFNVSINALLGAPQKRICQCCGMPLEDEIISRNADGTPNDDYCKWCYADGTYTYSSMDDLIEVSVRHMVSDSFTEAHLKELAEMKEGFTIMRNLCRINDKDRAFTGGKCSGNLVIEIHMPRRVDQVEGILLPVLRLIYNTHSLGLYCDSALTLQVHIVQDLLLHLAAGQRAGMLNQTVRQRRLAVVNMRNNTKIPDSILCRQYFIRSCLYILSGKNKSRPKGSPYVDGSYLPSDLSLLEIVSYAPLGMNIPRITRIFLNLFAKPPDVYIHRTDIAGIIKSPHQVEKIISLVYLIRIGDQKL